MLELFIALNDNVSHVRYAAAHALGQCHTLLGPFLDSVTPKLLIALKDNVSHVRYAAAHALGQCAEHDPNSVIPELLIALNDNDSDVRQAAAQALGLCHTLLGPFLDSVIPNLLTALKDNDSWKVRQAAAQALGTIGSVDTLQSWIKNVFSENKANLESEKNFPTTNNH